MLKFPPTASIAVKEAVALFSHCIDAVVLPFTSAATVPVLLMYIAENLLSAEADLIRVPSQRGPLPPMKLPETVS